MEKEKEIFLSVRDLNVIYTSNKEIVHAVNGISFDMEPGETLALVGETGAGKTTIARAIMSILPDPPAKRTNGEIWFEGENLCELGEAKMREIRGNRIAMIFQDPMTALNPLMTVGDQIVEGLLLHNDYSKEEAHEKAVEMLEMVGIHSGRFYEYPFEFSGGMKQRVVIAMALACKPVLLLADEPTTALDVTIQAQVLDLIKDLQEKYKTSMILITHDLGVVAETSDNVAVVYAGQIIEYGSKEDIFVRTAHPYTKGLFDSLPKMDDDTSNRLRPIPGSMPDPIHLPDGCTFHPRCPFAREECKKGKWPLKELTPGHFTRCDYHQQEG